MASKKPKQDIGRAGRVEREARMNRIITIVMVAIVAFVIIGGIGVSVYKYLIEPGQTILTVDEVEVPTRDFQSRVRFIRQQLIGQYSSMYEYLQYFASISAEGSENIINMYYQQMVSLQNNLDNYEYIGYNVILGMADEIILKAEAEKLGISISDQELEEGIQAFFNYYPETEEDLEDVETDIEDSQESEDAEDGNETQPEVTPEPTVDPYLKYLDDYKVFLETFYKDLNFSEEQFKDYIEAQLIAEKLYQKITKDTDTIFPQISVRHILVNDPELASHIILDYEEINSWTGIEVFYEQDGTTILSSGDLGWINEINQPVLYAATEGAEVGQVLSPIQTDTGYYIIYIEDIDPEMELSEDDLETRKSEVFKDWLSEVSQEYEVFYKDDWDSRIPKEPEIPFQLRLQQ